MVLELHNIYDSFHFDIFIKLKNKYVSRSESETDVFHIHIQKQGYKVQFSKDYIRKIIIKKLKIFKSNTYCLKIHKLKMSFGILCQGYQISSLSLKNFFMSTKKKYI